jgi:hypothetical protein
VILRIEFDERLLCVVAQEHIPKAKMSIVSHVTFIATPLFVTASLKPYHWNKENKSAYIHRLTSCEYPINRGVAIWAAAALLDLIVQQVCLPPHSPQSMELVKPMKHIHHL